MAATAPCLSPEICGAQSHRKGGQAYIDCQNRAKQNKKGKKGKEVSSAKVESAVPNGRFENQEDLNDFAAAVFMDIEGDNPDLHDALCAVLTKREAKSLRGLAESTSRFLEREEKTEFGSDYQQRLDSLLSNPEVRDVIRDDMMISNQEYDQFVQATRNAVIDLPRNEVAVEQETVASEVAEVEVDGEPDEYGLTPKARARLTEGLAEYTRMEAENAKATLEIKERKAVMEAFKDSLRNDYPAIVGNSLMTFEEAEAQVRVTPKSTVSEDLAVEKLPKKIIKKATVHHPAYVERIQHEARDEIDMDRLQEIITPEQLQSIKQPQTSQVTIKNIATK